MSKTVLLVGYTGHGKSTVGNLLINMSCEMSQLKEPFKTSGSASGCTEFFEINSGSKYKVLDTVGYGDPMLSLTNVYYCYDEIDKALKSVENKVDIVLFVVEGGRFSDEIVSFFDFIQTKVFKNNLKNNSVLLLTKCSKGYVNNSQTNPLLRKALDACKVYFELDLDMDKDGSTQTQKKENEKTREKIILEFLKFLEAQDFHRSEIKLLSKMQINYF